MMEEQERINRIKIENYIYIENVKEELKKVFHDNSITKNTVNALFLTSILPDIDMNDIDKLDKIELKGDDKLIKLFDDLKLADTNQKLEKSIEDRKNVTDSFERTCDEFDVALQNYLEVIN
jgi:hypothetical protein